LEIQEPVGEVTAVSAVAANVLEKYGIDYCCAGKRHFDDVCREKGLVPEAVKNEIANAATALSKETKDWSAASLRELIRHIVGTHHEYLKLELPRVGQRLRRVVQAHGEKDPVALHELETVYEVLSQEMSLHMHKEELMLFPAIERYEAAMQGGSLLQPAPFGSIANPIAVMEGTRQCGQGLSTDSRAHHRLSSARLRLFHLPCPAGWAEGARDRSTHAYSPREQHPLPTSHCSRI
jgi:regulator of cell morphogenesis and NO signaling